MDAIAGEKRPAMIEHGKIRRHPTRLTIAITPFRGRGSRLIFFLVLLLVAGHIVIFLVIVFFVVVIIILEPGLI